MNFVYYRKIRRKIKNYGSYDMHLHYSFAPSRIPVNSPGFPGSLQVFHEISRSPG